MGIQFRGLERDESIKNRNNILTLNWFVAYLFHY